MKEYIEERLKQLETEKQGYYELLENSKVFAESYLIARIRSCKDKIDELELLKESLEME